VATRDHKDGVALSQRFFEDGKVLADPQKGKTQLALAELLLNEAYEVWKRHPDGYDTAILAMELLAQAPGRGEDRWKKIVDLRQRRLYQTQRSWGPGRAEEIREAK